ncbi:hypothetical protein CN151_32025 [Sinorhizobium meliloti]|uniref:Uncharacterized protein n=2 Tax=Rhizobium meliloti TaxID=382 RepID=Q92ZK5_RHIME|nr:hypothetical protein SMa0850 [Sinorhizobium meliloti 1021]AGG70147.1 Hypothetical protein SM2011_a0850 [Sinorhizobium meliloti 2011]ASP60453.1 hypothetical protein CDO30_19205 [Sinorhizobium meliloti]MQW36270.1 hypothetical protein [Sinorhizobium meliloti]MQW42060.1 hypothetical protein [Sinorhizobium meliloti]
MHLATMGTLSSCRFTPGRTVSLGRSQERYCVLDGADRPKYGWRAAERAPLKRPVPPRAPHGFSIVKTLLRVQFPTPRRNAAAKHSSVSADRSPRWRRGATDGTPTFGAGSRIVIGSDERSI